MIKSAVVASTLVVVVVAALVARGQVSEYSTWTRLRTVFQTGLTIENTPCHLLEYQSPDQGKAGQPYLHLLPGDWSRTVFGGPLPDPRHVSYILQSSVSLRENPLPNDPLGTTLDQFDELHDETGLSQYFVQFGQFVNHDSENNKFTDSNNLATDLTYGDVTNDPVFAPGPPNNPNFNNPTGQNLTASDTIGEVIDGKLYATNNGNSYLDLSTIYGVDTATNKALRTLKGGELLTGSYVGDGGAYSPYLQPLALTNLLPSTAQTGIQTGVVNNPPISDAETCVSGDSRAMENVFLSTQHLIWIREHNRLARLIATSSWGQKQSDEVIFQAARRVNIAQYQEIVFNEFVPLLINQNMPRYRGYDIGVDTSTSIEFASAALRYGHSNLRDVTVVACDKPLGMYNKTFLQGAGLAALTNPNHLGFNGGVFTIPQPTNVLDYTYSRILRFAAGINGDPTDNLIVSSILSAAARTDLSIINFMTAIPGADIAALDTARGRRNGVPAYNVLRAKFGPGDLYKPAVASNPCQISNSVDPVACFAKISSDPVTQANLQKAYGKVSAIDPLMGMLAEDRTDGQHVGPTLKTILLSEFTRKRDGDRFYVKYDRLLSSLKDLGIGDHSLREELVADGVKYADIISRNTGVRNLKDVFRVPAADRRPMPTICTADQHKGRCRNAQFSCIDCSTTFHGTDYRNHTTCISEAEKYQKSVYKGKKHVPTTTQVQEIKPHPNDISKAPTTESLISQLKKKEQQGETKKRPAEVEEGSKKKKVKGEEDKGDKAKESKQEAAADTPNGGDKNDSDVIKAIRTILKKSESSLSIGKLKMKTVKKISKKLNIGAEEAESRFDTAVTVSLNDDGLLILDQ